MSSGGASAGLGGSSPSVNGAGGNQAGGGQSAATAGGGSSGGGGAEIGGGWGELGGDSAGGGSAAAAGEGGAADTLTDFDGRCGQGWAAGGAAPAPHLEGSVTPQVDSTGNWSFSFGRYRFVVAGAAGARVIEFSIDTVNLLDPTGGSTFWPSPQQAWTWPPAAEIDTAAYTAQSDATSVTLSSAISTTLGLSVQKRFSVNANSGVVSIEYRLKNESQASASWAPWEITRVRAGGYTFAPKGPGNRTITEDSNFAALPLSLLPPPPAENGIEWLNYPSISASLTKSDYIVEFDGAEGWLAHADKLGKNSLPVLFVKSFVDAPDASLPTNQAEIQLWTSGTANPKLIEVEEQGAQQVLAAGASLSWTVHWSACQLPSTLTLAAGSAELASLARAHAVKP
ncbi:MAG TPA: DUF4380 domain-containing protein [Polyangiaceae bacterium]